MKNKLSDLNDHLFVQLERLADEDLTAEQLDIEVRRADALVEVSDRITDNARTIIAGCQLVAKHGDKFLAPLSMLNGPKADRSDQ